MAKNKKKDRAVIVEGEITGDTVRNFVIGIVLIIVLFFGFNAFNLWSMGEAVPVQEAVKQIKEGSVQEVTIRDNSVILQKNDGKRYYTMVDSKTSFFELLQRDGIVLSQINAKITVPPSAGITFGDVLTLIFIGATIYGIFTFLNILKKQSGGGGGLMSFGKSTARVIIGKRPEVTFKDVAGANESKQEISEVVDFLKDPKAFFDMGARIPRGVLLVGDPGTGKTLLARAVAGEAKAPFFHTSGPEFEEMLVGAGAARVRDLFKRAKSLSPAIIFIDEIDAVARRRGLDLKSSSTEQTLNQILVEMDGFEKRDAVIVIAATNRPDVLDPAVLRPGRFDRIVTLSLPDHNEREEILKIHARNKKLAEDISMKEVAQFTLGFSGAQLENLMNEAAIQAVRNKHALITKEDMKEAILKVSLGPRRESMTMTEESIKNTAYHEAGHAIVGAYLKHADKIRSISIVPRGRSLGVTYSMSDTDKTNETYGSLVDDIAMFAAGRVAEELIFGVDNITTGASSDIQRATYLANKLVKRFGMNDKVGFIQYEDDREYDYLAFKPNYSDETAKVIDQEVKKLVQEQYDKAKNILTRERKLLDTVANTLLSQEALQEAEFEALVEKYGTEKPPVKEKPRVQTVTEWITGNAKLSEGTGTQEEVQPQ
ncbi:MAG: ATP-dependent zinc metalloprotease FtsH [Candidatus Dojkabacteria bacterium]|nr:MAG: ATP-dependent zinc metalloprotease FtsH [Candidatus Dojkabacteria bacterium]